MNLDKIHEKLNKNVNEETSYVNSLSFWKYLLIYSPILFVMFAVAQFLGSLLFDFEFEWIQILIQAASFAIFFRIFHKIRHYWNSNRKFQ